MTGGAWRGLGRREDLDIDFGRRPRSYVVTSILAACGNPDPLRLTLSGRIGGLCSVVALTDGSADVVARLRCPAVACGEALDVPLPIDRLQEMAASAEAVPRVDVSVEGLPPLRLRRPTGQDPRRWQAAAYESLEQAMVVMVSSLLEGDEPPPATLAAAGLAAVSAALEELDPLPSFKVTTVCVACEAESGHAIDLEGLLLDRLRRRQVTLIGEVHQLASRYGWREDDTLAIPAWRRRAYLDLIEVTP